MPLITRPQVYRVVRELLPKERFGPEERITVVYGVIVYAIRFKNPSLLSVIDVKKITACGESGFPARFLDRTRDALGRFVAEPAAETPAVKDRKPTNRNRRAPQLRTRYPGQPSEFLRKGKAAEARALAKAPSRNANRNANRSMFALMQRNPIFRCIEPPIPHLLQPDPRLPALEPDPPCNKT